MSDKKSNINEKLRSLTKEQANALSNALNAGYDGKKPAVKNKAKAKSKSKKP